MYALYKPKASILLVVFSYLLAGSVAAAYGSLIGNYSRPEVFSVYAAVFLLAMVRSLFYKYELLRDPKYGFGIPSSQSMLFCILIAILLFQLDIFINTLAHLQALGSSIRTSDFYGALEESVSNIPTPHGVWLLTLQAAIFGSVYEEIAYRGILQPSLTNTRLRAPGAIVFTSILWSIDHMNSGVEWALFSVFIMGVVLGLVRQYFNNTYLCIMVHLAFNLGWIFLGYTIHS